MPRYLVQTINKYDDNTDYFFSNKKEAEEYFNEVSIDIDEGQVEGIENVFLIDLKRPKEKICYRS